MYLFFLLFFTAVIALGSILVGPFSIRVYFSVIMIVLLLLIPSKVKWRMPAKYIIIYMIYLIFYGLSLSMNGEFKSHGYIKQVLAFHLICITIYYACHSFITTKKQLEGATIALMVLLVLTCLATILQYYGSALGWGIAVAFNSGGLTETIQNNMTDEGGDFLGRSITVGIFPYVFTNAMFIASSGIVPLYGFFDKEKTPLQRVIYLLISLLAIVACFMTQQRAAFGSMIIGFIIMLLLFGNKKKVWLAVLALVFLLLSTNIDYAALIDNEKLGRIGSIFSFNEDSSRQSLRSTASYFLKDNLLWGGPEKYKILAGKASHNFIYNAFIYGGLFGGISIIVLFILMSIRCVKRILSSHRTIQLSPFYAMGVLIFFVCGFFHNASLVIGSSQIFVLFSLMIVAEQFDNQTTY